ncbi:MULTISPECIES: FAD-dependent thymidylate synthase [Thermus]|jgi:thymidylate synthase (FAD)|uniref:Flavin-dependent thymidylate synthase n=1 Tax=Thermus brockianus TaxID=56956 RepID=A0A1J0LQU9_THEBO|nr:FAD-dependent thymidylate synthase [Thermus brockianus]APD08670.1 FAD-dependent thymidylate synthase [Thermus brockianus]BDG15971.1 flavin-dependent thymidylate synthase [Thermus brockianus]
MEGDAIPVLDKGFVRLVDVMGDDRAIVQAARVSYGEGTRTVREDAALIDYLMRHRHTSPFEMVEFKFHVKAPLFVVRQWFRHRTASVNEISGRYSVLKDEFYEPNAFRRQAKRNKQGSEGELADEEALALLREAEREAYRVYEKLLEKGVAREMARLVLPLNLYTEFYWKQDLHNLFHFLKLRLSPDAQWEIREYAKAIAEIVKAHVPLAWASFEEHVLHGATLSRTELKALEGLLTPELYEKALGALGLSGSRLKEALEKIFGPKA